MCGGEAEGSSFAKTEMDLSLETMEESTYGSIEVGHRLHIRCSSLVALLTPLITRFARRRSPITAGSFLALPTNAEEFDTEELLDDKKSNAPFSAKIDIFSTRIKSVLEGQDFRVGKEAYLKACKENSGERVRGVKDEGEARGANGVRSERRSCEKATATRQHHLNNFATRCRFLVAVAFSLLTLL